MPGAAWTDIRQICLTVSTHTLLYNGAMLYDQHRRDGLWLLEALSSCEADRSATRLCMTKCSNARLPLKAKEAKFSSNAGPKDQLLQLTILVGGGL